MATPFSKAPAGKVALVTGAARGIGRASAERLAQGGATVVALDVPAAVDELRRVCAQFDAVAPGFIQTAMIGQMPFLPREIGRRLNSLKQAGLPRDVAELVTFLSTPAASGISGNTVRVCGQGLIGA